MQEMLAVGMDAMVIKTAALGENIGWQLVNSMELIYLICRFRTTKTSWEDN